MVRRASPLLYVPNDGQSTPLLRVARDDAPGLTRGLREKPTDLPLLTQISEHSSPNQSWLNQYRHPPNRRAEALLAVQHDVAMIALPKAAPDSEEFLHSPSHLKFLVPYHHGAVAKPPARSPPEMSMETCTHGMPLCKSTAATRNSTRMMDTKDAISFR